jgi:hypothetical protein
MWLCYKYTVVFKRESVYLSTLLSYNGMTIIKVIMERSSLPAHTVPFQNYSMDLIKSGSVDLQ